MIEQIRKCDRCRKMITDREAAEFEKRNIRLYDYSGEEYDICPECFEMLEDWMDLDPAEYEK